MTVPAAAKAAAKGAASSSRNVKAKPSKAEQGSPHDSKEEQGSPHDSKEEGDLRARTPRVRTGCDTATPTGYDSEGAASRAEDDAEEEADPQTKASC